MATQYHYASGDIDDNGSMAAAAAVGFNVADVGDPETLKSLPANVKAIYYLDEAKGVTANFLKQMNAIKGDPHLLAIYLADEPVPGKILASDLKAESDWIHANMPGVKTFIVAYNTGSNQNPSFGNYYTVENTHIDLWGLDPYPIRSEMRTPDYTEIGRTISAAVSQIGVKPENIIPVYQAFGGVNDGDNGEWVLPTPEQERAIIAEFAKYVPNPVFDYAYSWMKQDGDDPLSESAALQAVFKEHNAGLDGTGGTTGGTGTGGTGTGTGGTETGGETGTGGTTGGTSGSSGENYAGTKWDDTHAGTGQDDMISGGTGNDVLRGRGGNDIISGGPGNDKLVGGAGEDSFVFHEYGRANADRITDFTPGSDHIVLDHAVFTQAGAVGELSLDAFFVGTRAHDATDRVIYNASSGDLFYDSDGTGSAAQQLIVHLQTGLNLEHGDIIIG